MEPIVQTFGTLHSETTIKLLAIDVCRQNTSNKQNLKFIQFDLYLKFITFVYRKIEILCIKTLNKYLKIHK